MGYIYVCINNDFLIITSVQLVFPPLAYHPVYQDIFYENC